MTKEEAFKIIAEFKAIRSDIQQDEHLKFCGWCRQGLKCPGKDGVMISDVFLQELKERAEEETCGDLLGKKGSDTIVDDFAGGNVDDAFYQGVRKGEANIARAVLLDLGITFKIKE